MSEHTFPVGQRVEAASAEWRNLGGPALKALADAGNADAVREIARRKHNKAVSGKADAPKGTADTAATPTQAAAPKAPASAAPVSAAAVDRDGAPTMAACKAIFESGFYTPAQRLQALDVYEGKCSKRGWSLSRAQKDLRASLLAGTAHIPSEPVQASAPAPAPVVAAPIPATESAGTSDLTDQQISDRIEVLRSHGYADLAAQYERTLVDRWIRAERAVAPAPAPVVAGVPSTVAPPPAPAPVVASANPWSAKLAELAGLSADDYAKMLTRDERRHQLELAVASVSRSLDIPTSAVYDALTKTNTGTETESDKAVIRAVKARTGANLGLHKGRKEVELRTQFDAWELAHKQEISREVAKQARQGERAVVNGTASPVVTSSVPVQIPDKRDQAMEILRQLKAQNQALMAQVEALIG